MAIENTYRSVLIEDYIRDQLSLGVSVSAETVVDEVNTLLTETDLTTPQFVAESFHVERDASSSSQLFQNTFLGMRQDLRILYKELMSLMDVNQKAFTRWGLEADNIEKRLIDLEERIENLLLLAQDTEGYQGVLIDNFTDTLLIDQDVSTVNADLTAEMIELGVNTESAGNTRQFLNNLDVNDDITFKVRTTVDMIPRVDAVGTSLADMFAQESKVWWTSVNMKTQKPVTCELNVRLSPDGSIPISKIFMELHDSAESSPIFITPLYSVDNRNWNQIPSVTYTAEVRTSIMFSFREVEAQWIKFILQKRGPDPSSGQSFFSYQFGFKNIVLYRQGFDVDDPDIFISTPLHIEDVDGVVRGFEKVTLQTCERLEENTSINYYITTSNDSDVPLDSDLEPTDGVWAPISPLQRTERLHTHILNVGDAAGTTIGDTESDAIDSEILKVSYDGRESDSDFINPAADFKLLYRDPTSGAITSEDRSADSIVRYAFANSNERILNYQLKETNSGLSDSALSINKNDFFIFRNIGKQGLTPGDVDGQVRGIQRGWKFEDPYYSCVVEISNPDGMVVDVGNSSIIIDDVTYSNLIDNTVLTGKSGITGDPDRDTGIHTIKVHKNNWKEVEPDKTTLALLKAADPLYPYNHKLLVEGYQYHDDYSDTEEKTYTGMDLFAETVMVPVSIFDLTTNIATDKYDVYALDVDAPKSHTAPDDDNDPTTVIVVKINEENPDFQNERFVLRFTLINELRKYLRLRADLSTEDERVSPGLHSYKIKLG